MKPCIDCQKRPTRTPLAFRCERCRAIHSKAMAKEWRQRNLYEINRRERERRRKNFVPKKYECIACGKKTEGRKKRCETHWKEYKLERYKLHHLIIQANVSKKCADTYRKNHPKKQHKCLVCKTPLDGFRIRCKVCKEARKIQLRERRKAQEKERELPLESWPWKHIEEKILRELKAGK